ncbi:MAG: hypothetical protein LBS49_01740, partial [Candidatus Accumulibacter sp.]|nr:hypothetical protein [Accumulibacter sp.]
MKLLGAILKGLLLLLLIVIVLGLLTVLSWWLRWPMFTGFFILLGLFGAALLFWAGRFLWRLRDKRSFVRQALSGLKTPAAAEVQVSGIETVWNALLARDPGKRPDRREFLGRSWYLALDGAGSAAASAFSLSPLFTGKEESGPLARRDFASTTLLQAAAGALEGDGKEQFLALFARDVPGSAFSGFFLLLSARDLLSRADTALQEWGFQLRDALYSVMVATNRNAPLYLLVQDMDALPGGASLFARPKGGETLPGRFFDAGDAPDEGGERPGEAAARALAATLRTVLFDDLVQGAPAAQDELRFLEESGTLGRRLDAFFSALLQEMPRQEPLRLAGVFFCPTRPVRENSAGAPPGAVEAKAEATGSARPNSALSRFFTRLLPVHGAAAHGLRGRLSAYSSAWIVGMGAWYLVLLCVCGLMAANVLYQN